MAFFEWLKQSPVALPAWLLAESARPLAWLVGQAALVGSPFAAALGVACWDEWVESLTEAERYEEVCRELEASVRDGAGSRW